MRCVLRVVCTANSCDDHLFLGGVTVSAEHAYTFVCMHIWHTDGLTDWQIDTRTHTHTHTHSLKAFCHGVAEVISFHYSEGVYEWHWWGPRGAVQSGQMVEHFLKNCERRARSKRARPKTHLRWAGRVYAAAGPYTANSYGLKSWYSKSMYYRKFGLLFSVNQRGVMLLPARTQQVLTVWNVVTAD